MNVKNTGKPEQRILTLMQNQNGMLYAHDLVKLNIPRSYLSILMRKGKIQRVGRGVYKSPAAITDDMALLQAQYKKTIFSHETALFLLDLTDRNPLFFSVTVSSGYNATVLKAQGVKVYFVKPDLFSLGMIDAKTPGGKLVSTYSPERTLCDLVRNRNQIDIQMINGAFKRYVQRKDRNLDQLVEYSRLFRVEKVLRAYIEVLL